MKTGRHRGNQTLRGRERAGGEIKRKKSQKRGWASEGTETEEEEGVKEKESMSDCFTGLF